MTTPRTNFRRRAGFLLPDIIFGLVVGLMILLAMSVSLSQYRHASRRLAQHREASALAERVLTDLQSGQTPPPAPAGFSVQVRDLPAPGLTPAPGSPAHWVQVQVQGPAGKILLTGLVPAAVKGDQP